MDLDCISLTRKELPPGVLVLRGGIFAVGSWVWVLGAGSSYQSLFPPSGDGTTFSLWDHRPKPRHALFLYLGSGGLHPWVQEWACDLGLAHPLSSLGPQQGVVM